MCASGKWVGKEHVFRRWTRNVLLLAGLAWIGLAAGCASGPRNGPVSPVESLYLFCTPIAVDLDRVPGPDGFSARLFAKGPKGSKGVTIAKGAVEVLMYDGLHTEGTTPAPVPLRTWHFEGAELRKHEGKSAVGAGYRFTLRWDQARPTQSQISIVARYLPVSGPPVVTAPSSVTIGTR